MSKHAARVLVRPLLTEKGTAMAESSNTVLFRVARDANKIEIRRAVEATYGVRVIEVRTQVVRGKLKRMGRNFGRKPTWKKAIVKLGSESSIDFFSAG